MIEERTGVRYSISGAYRLEQIANKQANGRTVELRYQDEARVGQIGRTGRVWYERCVRPRGIRDMRHEAGWIFGAICPERIPALPS